MTFADSLEPDQDLQYVSPDQDQNSLTLCKCSCQKEFFEKVNFPANHKHLMSFNVMSCNTISVNVPI